MHQCTTCCTPAWPCVHDPSTGQRAESDSGILPHVQKALHGMIWYGMVWPWPGARQWYFATYQNGIAWYNNKWPYTTWHYMALPCFIAGQRHDVWLGRVSGLVVSHPLESRPHQRLELHPVPGIWGRYIEAVASVNPTGASEPISLITVQTKWVLSPR
jgi:hypothetical protein